MVIVFLDRLFIEFGGQNMMTMFKKVKFEKNSVRVLCLKNRNSRLYLVMKQNLKDILFIFFISLIGIQSFAQNDVEKLFQDRDYHKVIEALTIKEKNSSLDLREYFLVAKSYGRTKQYNNGLVYSNVMIEKCMVMKDTTNLVIAYNLKAENLIDLDRMHEGVVFCEEISSVFREQDSIQFQNLCFKWGMLYYHTEKYQKAYNTYGKITLPKYRELSLFKDNYALTLMGVSKLDEAIEYLKESVELRYIRGNTNQVSVSLNNIARIYQKKKNWKLAKKYLDSASNSLSKNSSLSKKKGAYLAYYNLYKEQGEIEKAKFFLELIEYNNEEIFRKKINEKINALDVSYKREQVLKEKVKVSEKQTLWIVIGALFAVIGLLSTVFFFMYKNVKSIHKNTITEQQLLRSQMTPHFLFNSLSVIQGMILQKEDKKAIRYLSKFSRLLRLILESSREKLVPLSKELIAIESYVDLQNMSKINQFSYVFVSDDQIDIDMLLIPPMIIQPFIENAIEHGFKEPINNAEIIMEITIKEDMVICVVKDNGVGISTIKSSNENHKKSLATKITSERLKMLSKSSKKVSRVVIENRNVYNEQGTQVTLTIPFKNIYKND
ncbi:histidine kinase [Aquimarina sp. I32.4]|uniref:histidine kinase n=1 Tax=Aquimarina sp. I32.4 TaxID=2053903 RepID=UPI000CDEC6FD|nr:histidine kinase [Aquimarina sp. I32.4]